MHDGRIASHVRDSCYLPQALHLASKYEHAETALVLIEKDVFLVNMVGIGYKLTPLMIASYCGNVELVRILLEAGANPAAVDSVSTARAELS